MSISTRILPGDDEASIHRAADVLRAGGLVGMPTETVYGLAAHALDTAAVAKVFEAKGRPSFDPLIVHLAETADAGLYAVSSDDATRLAEAFWPGPMTLVLPRRKDEKGLPIVPDLVTAGLDSVALRVPAHPVARTLLKRSGLPLAAPSANRFGSISPTTALHVRGELGERVDVILDGGPCERGVESTVLRIASDRVEVLRLGALPIEAIEVQVDRPVAVMTPSSSPGLNGSDTALVSPGTTKRHYAPATPMRLVASADEIATIAVPGRLGLLSIGPTQVDDARFTVKRCLSDSGDLAEAASRLFATLRELDAMGLDGIVALAAPEEGLGRAINDRLKRGSAR
ncbi:MAG: L-threonylcarbamoyladenylate synthase [Phycisphaeraceae bacterium]